MRKVFFYGTDDAALTYYRQLLGDMFVHVFVLGDDSLEQKLGEVMDAEEDDFSGHARFAGEFMLMQELEKTELIAMLNLFEDAGYAFEGVKIMRNEENAGICLNELFEITARQHSVINRVRILEQLAASCSGIDLEAMPELLRQRLQKALMQAYMIIQYRRYDEAEIEHCMREITECLRQSGPVSARK